MISFHKLREIFGIRRKLIKLLEKSGYYILPKTSLPVGVDFAEDIKAKLNILPKVIFDIGANYGQTAVYFSEQFPNSTIHSFEPIKNSYQKLITNTKHLKNVLCFQNAFGDANTTLKVSLYKEDESYLNSLNPVHANLSSTALKEDVSVKTLDSFVESKNIQEIDLLKIDTEGYEIEVLNGAKEIIKKGKVKLILCEVSLSPLNKRNTPLTNISTFLEPYNYALLGLYDTNISFLKEGLTYSNALFIRV